MGRVSTFTARAVRGIPVVRTVARSILGHVPDVPWTVRVPGIGGVRIKLLRDKGVWTRSLIGQDDRALGILERFIGPGDVVYDIGGYIGLYARVMVQWFGAEQVISFEPMRQNLELFERNVELGRLGDRIRVFGVALGDVEGEELLQVDDVRGGTAVLDRVSGGKPSLGRRLRHLPPKTETVRVVPLDTLVRDEKLPPPDVIKIDTEGAAGLVLRGGLETIERHRPKLVISIHDVEEARSVVETLQPVGYQCYGFLERGDLEAYQRLVPGNEEWPYTGDVICSCDPDDVNQPIEALRAIPERARSRPVAVSAAR